MDSLFAFYDAHIVPLLGTVVGKLVLALAILLVGRWSAGRFHRAVLKLMQRSGFDDTLAKFLGQLCYGFMLMVVVLVAALPSASNVALLSERFGADTGRIAMIILVTTAAAFFTFSGAVALLNG